MNDLIVTARRLARATLHKPKQADLKRAVSTAYYALFHALAEQCADLLVGRGRARNTAAWNQVYRALEHGFAKNACRQTAGLGFAREIVDFADMFAKLQDERHRADYDPAARYTRAEAQTFITDAEQAIRAFNASAREDRKAFAVLVLLKRRP